MIHLVKEMLTFPFPPSLLIHEEVVFDLRLIRYDSTLILIAGSICLCHWCILPTSNCFNFYEL